MSSWLVLVTGASRGFGRALALAFTEHKALLDNGDLHLHLWSRDKVGLSGTAKILKEAWKSKIYNLVITETIVDLGDSSVYPATVDSFVASISSTQFDRIVIVHNAGSLGEVGRISEVTSPEKIQNEMELNVNSVLWFNKRFLEQYKGSSSEKAQVYFVNVSSLNAIEPFATCGLYCVFKAARDMHFRVLAKEEPEMKSLNYAPGPMMTAMNDILREGPSTDPELQQMFKQLKDDGNYVDVNVSAALCVKHLFGPTLVSGSHIDYYDIYQS